MTTQKNRWNADAEMAMMGFVIPVESIDHIIHLIGYVLYTLKQNEDDTLADRIYSSAMKYNSEKHSITHFTINGSPFGTLMTFVRDGKMTEKKLISRDGVLSYVYNVDYPDCSELGYVFFNKEQGKVRRVA